MKFNTMKMPNGKQMDLISGEAGDCSVVCKDGTIEIEGTNGDLMMVVVSALEKVLPPFKGTLTLRVNSNEPDKELVINVRKLDVPPNRKA